MLWFLLGLFGFLGLHSIRIVAPRWREARIAALGAGTWKALYSVLSIALFVLLIWGYGLARQAPTLLWLPPVGLRHLGALLVLLAFVLLLAAYVPRNHIKARLQHPMMLSIKLWAFAHLLMVGWLHSIILSGAFLFWAVLGFASARRRGPISSPPSSAAMTGLTVLLGIAAWAGFAFYLHAKLIGVAPFG